MPLELVLIINVGTAGVVTFIVVLNGQFPMTLYIFVNKLLFDLAD
jgi:hypothetical protein